MKIFSRDFITVAIVLLFVPITTLGQIDDDWFRLLPDIPQCNAKVYPITNDRGQFSQKIVYSRKKSDGELREEAIPLKEGEVWVVSDFEAGVDYNECGWIAISVGTPRPQKRSKIEKEQVRLHMPMHHNPPLRERVLLRDFDAYLITNRAGCDYVPCFGDQYLEIELGKDKTIELHFKNHVDGFAYSRSIDYTTVRTILADFATKRRLSD